MIREQLKNRVQGIGVVTALSSVVEGFAEADDYFPLGTTDIRLRDVFRRFWTLRRQVYVGTAGAANAQLASAYTSDLQQLISDWA